MLNVFRYAVQIVAWTLVSVIYRYEKSRRGDDNDLWGGGFVFDEGHGHSGDLPGRCRFSCALYSPGMSYRGE